MKRIEVVAAVIVSENRVLATQRGYGEFKDRWEFPGGKIEAGETPQNALSREIREELAADISIEKFLSTVECDYPAFHLTMRAYLCRLVSDKLKLLEHEAAKWLSANDIDSVDWLPADREILPALKMLLKR